MNRVLIIAFSIFSVFSECHTGPDTAPVLVISNFDAGSIDTLIETAPQFLTGRTRHWKHKTSSDQQYYWFYFELDRVKDKEITVKLNDLEGVYRGKPHLIYTQRTEPVYSYDQVNWNRIEKVQYDTAEHSLIFTHYFRQAPVWIAYAHPYPYEKEKAFIESLPHDKSMLGVDTLGYSAEKRPVHLITITDPLVSDRNKKTVLFTGLQHAGEYVSGFFIEGMVAFLLSDAPEARQIRKELNFKIVPMMNPDGIYHGITRFNNNKEDLNQEWDDDYSDFVYSPTEPEVAAVKKWLRNWLKSDNKIDLGLDVHSQGQEGDINILHAPSDTLGQLVKVLNNFWPVELIPMSFSGSANQCLTDEFHILSGTFEIPQSSIKEGKYLTPEDYRFYGKGTALGLAKYFRITKK